MHTNIAFDLSCIVYHFRILRISVLHLHTLIFTRASATSILSQVKWFDDCIRFNFLSKSILCSTNFALWRFVSTTYQDSSIASRTSAGIAPLSSTKRHWIYFNFSRTPVLRNYRFYTSKTVQSSSFSQELAKRTTTGSTFQSLPSSKMNGSSVDGWCSSKSLKDVS